MGCLRTIRPVQEGEEICVSYGAAYWRFDAKCKAKNARARNQLGLSAMDAGDTQTIGVARADAMMTALQAAAKTDASYAASVLNPPAGHVAAGGLLYLDGRLCVPDDGAVRTSILALNHDAITGAHFGRDKTLSAVKARFQWKGMTGTVERYVSSCEACQRNKPSQQLTPGALMPLPLPEQPFQEWTQDAVTALPTTRRGHDAIQVYVERSCKLKHFEAMTKNAGAVELAESMIRTVVRQHGVPLALISDRDPRFTASYYRVLSNKLGIEMRMSTARHPQSDGQSEREIRTMVTALELRAFCNDNQDDWDDHLDMLELGFNSTVQASTQHTPFELVYGMKPRLPIDVALARVARPDNPAAGDRAKRLKDAVQTARGYLIKAQQRQATNADRRDVPRLAVGDEVLLSTKGLTLRGFENKLGARYVGPYRVTKAVNANAYTLALPVPMSALHATFNIDKLKPYRSGLDEFPTRPIRFDRPPPAAQADSNGDVRWEVEAIVGERRMGRGKSYLIKWRGYPSEENEWAPRSELMHSAAEAVRDWEQAQAARLLADGLED